MGNNSGEHIMCDLGRCQLLTYYLLTSPNKHFLTASCAPNMRDVCVFECLCVSRSVTSNSLPPHGLYSPWSSPGQNTGVGSLSLLQQILPTQGSNPGFLQWGRILYQLIHKGSPRILEWVAYPFSRPSWRILPTQELNWSLLHFRQILCQLSYQGSPDIQYI